MSELLGEYRQGDDWTILMTFKVDTAAIDITDHVFTLTLVEDWDEAPVLQVIHTVPEFHGKDGICLIKVRHDQTSLVEAGKYYWDIQQQTPAGKINTVLPQAEDYKDRFVVHPGATDN
jgi:hypothetical protein